MPTPRQSIEHGLQEALSHAREPMAISALASKASRQLRDDDFAVVPRDVVARLEGLMDELRVDARYRRQPALLDEVRGLVEALGG